MKILKVLLVVGLSADLCEPLRLPARQYRMQRAADQLMAVTKDSQGVAGQEVTGVFSAEDYSGSFEYSYDDEDEVEEDGEYDDMDDPTYQSMIKQKRLKQNDQEWMFFDVAKINVKGGDGGAGCMAMRREFRLEFGGPCGGNGGAGGNVLIECDDTLNTLALLRRKYVLKL